MSWSSGLDRICLTLSRSPYAKTLAGTLRVTTARVQSGTHVYAAGDLHGRVELLQEIFARVDADLKADPASRAVQIFLGDYVDRRPSSKSVIDLLMGRSRTNDMLYLKSNHEALLLGFLEDPETFEAWERVGGGETLGSYGLSPLLKEFPRRPSELAALF